MKTPASPGLLFLVLVLLTSTNFVGCKKGCGQKAAEVPKTAEARVEQMTARLPAKVDTVFVLSDLGEMRDSINLVKGAFPNTGLVETVQKQFHQNFGLDLLDEQSWKNAGLVPDSSAVVAIHRSRVIVLTYVEDKQTFEKLLTDKAKATFQIEGVVKNETVGKHRLKVLSEDPAGQVAWLYDGKLAMIAMPATNTEGAVQDGSAKLVITEVADQKKEESIWADAGFQKFNETLVKKNPVALFLNTRAAVESEQMKEEIAKNADAKAVSDWVAENVTFIGAGFAAEEGQARVRAYLGLVDGTLAKLKAAKDVEAGVDWGSFGTEKTMLGVRLAVNPEKGYAELLAALPEANQRALKRDMKRVGDMLALDIEKDVLASLTGHVGLFFYGVAGSPLALMRGANNPAEIARSIGLMVVLKFKNAESVDALVNKVLQAGEGRVKVRPFVNLPDDASFKVLSFDDPAAVGNLFIHEDTVVYATNAFGDEAMHQYLTDSRDDKKLGATEKLDLGKEFVSEKGFTGVYFNSARAQENLGQVLAFGGVGDILASIEEAQLALDVDDTGLYGLLRVDLLKRAAAAPAAGTTPTPPTQNPSPTGQPQAPGATPEAE